MTVVILLLECSSERPTDVLVSLDMFYYSILTCTLCLLRCVILVCVSVRCVIDLLNYYLIIWAALSLSCYVLSALQSVVVRWEPPPDGSQNGIITGYKIRYRKRNEKSGETVTTDGSRRVYDITGNIIRWTRPYSKPVSFLHATVQADHQNTRFADCAFGCIV